MAKLIVRLLKSILLYLILCVATLLMLRMVIDYTAFRDDVDFLRFKYEVTTRMGVGWA